MARVAAGWRCPLQAKQAAILESVLGELLFVPTAEHDHAPAPTSLVPRTPSSSVARGLSSLDELHGAPRATAMWDQQRPASAFGGAVDGGLHGLRRRHLADEAVVGQSGTIGGFLLGRSARDSVALEEGGFLAVQN